MIGNAASDIADILAHEGVEILPIEDAQAARPVGPGDMLVCDARASGTALDLCARLRRSSRPLSLAVVSSYEEAEQALDEGYDDVVVAPYDPRELRLRVRKLLRAAGRTTMRVGALVISPVARQVQRWATESLQPRLQRLLGRLLLPLCSSAKRSLGR